MHEEEVLQEARSLWQQYRVLTKELMKFIDKQDIDTFLSIIPQREAVVEKLKALPENGFRESEEGVELIGELVPMDQQIIYKARAWLNKSRRQNSTVQAYRLSPALQSAGNIFNKKY